jgi:purine-binding chemotaxis protein CheW
MIPSERQDSGDLLAEVKANRLSQEAAGAPEEWVKVVLFRAGAERYAFHGRDIREILSGHEIHWLPGLPDFLPGLINVRGDIESVIDLQCLLGGAAGAAGGPKLFAMAVAEGFRSAIMVDAVEDVVDIPVGSIHPPLITLGEGVRDLVASQIQLGDSLVPLLDLDKLRARVTL